MSDIENTLARFGLTGEAAELYERLLNDNRRMARQLEALEQRVAEQESHSQNRPQAPAYDVIVKRTTQLVSDSPVPQASARVLTGTAAREAIEQKEAARRAELKRRGALTDDD